MVGSSRVVTRPMLDALECPFCGAALTQLDPDGGGTPDLYGSAGWTGVLRCDCNHYPVVAGIAVIRTGAIADATLDRLARNEPEEALLDLLGLAGERRDEFARTAGRASTFRSELTLLCDDLEAGYLLYRFSDPTFVAADALVRAVARAPGCANRPFVDVGGGAGHLTRTLTTLAPGGDVVLADIAFWKLWLASRYVAPLCRPVCCDANLPLPLGRGAFSVAMCSDAFHYVSARRSLAGELMRAAGSEGAVVLPHLHNALSWNYSEGMPLAPARYREFLPRPGTRIFSERAILDAVLAGGPVDLAGDPADAELGEGEPVLAVVSDPSEAVFGQHAIEPPPMRRPSLNPLYAADVGADGVELTRSFPSELYELEYEACKRYLPERATLSLEAWESLRSGASHRELEELAGRRVVLDLPERYL